MTFCNSQDDIYNLYQSDIWQYIQTQIYRKPVMKVPFLGQEYFTLIKKKEV